MKRERISGWKFIHPDLEPAAQNAGPAAQTTGLALSHLNGIERVSDDEAVRQSVLLLLSTRPGERVMRPEYGCDLQRLVFSPNDDTTAGIAIYLVRSALLQWEPRIEIRALDAYADPYNPAALIISLQYQVRLTKTNAEIQVSLNLAGEEG